MRSIAFDEGKRELVVTDCGGIIRRHQHVVWIPGSRSCWALDTGKFVSRALLFSSPVWRNPLSEGGHLRAEQDIEHVRIRLVDRHSGRTVRSLKPFVEQVRGFSPDVRFLVGANGDAWSGGYFTVVWNTATGAEVLSTGYSKSAAFSGDGRLLAIGYADSKVKVWDTDTWREAHTLKPRSQVRPNSQDEIVEGIVFSPDGTHLLAWSWGPPAASYWLWSMPDEKVLVQRSGAVTAGTFSPDGRTVAIAVDSRVEVWPLTK